MLLFVANKIQSEVSLIFISIPLRCLPGVRYLLFIRQVEALVGKEKDNDHRHRDQQEEMRKMMIRCSNSDVVETAREWI